MSTPRLVTMPRSTVEGSSAIAVRAAMGGPPFSSKSTLGSVAVLPGAKRPTTTPRSSLGPVASCVRVLPWAAGRDFWLLIGVRMLPRIFLAVDPFREEAVERSSRGAFHRDLEIAAPHEGGALVPRLGVLA